MHKLANGPSKAKIAALASVGMLLAGFLASWAWASDISISSGKGADTVILVGPGAEDGALETMRMESDPDNGTLLQVAPRRNGSEDVRPPETLIIMPEIHTRGKK